MGVATYLPLIMMRIYCFSYLFRQRIQKESSVDALSEQITKTINPHHDQWQICRHRLHHRCPAHPSQSYELRLPPPSVSEFSFSYLELSLAERTPRAQARPVPRRCMLEYALFSE